MRGSRVSGEHARRREAALIACIVLLGLGGCRRERPAGESPEPKLTPTETVERLLALRAAGEYERMVPLIVDGEGRAVAETLRAVDGFLRANRALVEYVRDHYSLELAEGIDQAALGGHLGVFSPNARLVSERVRGDEATVAFSVGGALPLKHARLVRVGGTWRYDPGPGYDPKLPRAFDEMARGLRGLLEDLKRPPLAEKVRADPQVLLTELKSRLAPGVKLLP